MPSEYLSQNEIDAATLVRSDEFNPQEQAKVDVAGEPVVARAYIDQLTRSKGLEASRIAALDAALSRAERARSGKDQAAAGEIDALAKQLNSEAGAAPSADGTRAKALAATLEGIAAKLR